MLLQGAQIAAGGGGAEPPGPPHFNHWVCQWIVRLVTRVSKNDLPINMLETLHCHPVG